MGFVLEPCDLRHIATDDLVELIVPHHLDHIGFDVDPMFLQASQPFQVPYIQGGGNTTVVNLVCLTARKVINVKIDGIQVRLAQSLPGRLSC